MQFPNEYKCLKQNIFSVLDYKIIPIRYKDRIDIMKWRNEQIYHLRQNKPLDEESQENYFKKNVKSLFKQDKPKQLLFSFFKDNECIGYGGLVHINWTDKNSEISFLMNTKLEKDYFKLHWNIFLQLIEKVAFLELKLHKIYTYAFDLRPKLYEVLEKMSYVEEARLKGHCFFDKKYIDVLIHSKINK